MDEISSRQICDLILDISRSVATLDASMDELLIDIRAQNREALAPIRRYHEPSQNFSGILDQ